MGRDLGVGVCKSYLGDVPINFLQHLHELELTISLGNRIGLHNSL